MAPPTVASPPPTGTLPTPPGFNGTAQGGETGVAGAGVVIQPAAPAVNLSYQAILVLRFAAAVLAFVAAVVMGAAKQTKTTEISLNHHVVINSTLKSTSVSQLRFFISANVLACAYAAVSMGIAATYRACSPRSTALVIAAADVVAVALVFAAVGSGSAVIVLAKQRGDCDIFGKFCGQVSGAIAMSSLAGGAFVGLVLLTLLGLHQGTV